MTTSTELEPALDGVDAVLLQLRVGGQAARLQDETWPLECGSVGQETTGAGGLAKALRTVPVVLDIADRVRKAAPDAWIIDFTNPVGIVTRALLQDGHRAVGLCNVAIGFQRRFAGCSASRRRGRARPCRAQPPDLGASGHASTASTGCLSSSPRQGRDRREHWGCPSSWCGTLGVVPSYYLRYFYAHDEVVAEQLPRARGRPGGRDRARLLDLYADPALDEKPELLMERGGAYYSEAAVQLAAALLEAGAPRRRRWSTCATTARCRSSPTTR